MAHGQFRVLLVDRAAGVVTALARVARLAVRLVTRTSMGPSDIYAAVATAKFLAAHELIESAAEAAEASGDPDIEVTHINLPLWFGGITIHEETQ
jgi:hypothetical protein